MISQWLPMLLGSTLSPPAPPSLPPKSPPPALPDGTRFTFHSGASTWAEARAACQSAGSDLASIRSAAEDAEAWGLTGGQSTWIGFTDAAEEGTWVWSDGSTVNYTNWGTPEPTNNYGAEHCGKYQGSSSGYWASAYCDDTNAYLCNVFWPPSPPAPPGAPPSPPSPPSPPAPPSLPPKSPPPALPDGTRFTFHSGASTWAEARAACQSAGSDLASIRSAAEDAEAWGLTGGQSTWIGFTDAAEEGTWVWSDGSTVNYTNWGTPEPTNNYGAEHCGKYQGSSSGYWASAYCDDTNAYLCNVFWPPPNTPSPPSYPKHHHPPSTPSAGNDPIFTGADGLDYEVKGGAGRVFNLVSSRSLSINAEFQAVPAGFRYVGLPHDDNPSKLNARQLTETTLGSVHVAMRSANSHTGVGSSDSSERGPATIEIEVRSGRVQCTFEGAPAACSDALHQVSAAFSEEVRVCSLSTMACEWLEPQASRATLMQLDRVQPGITRLRLQLGERVEVVLYRDSITAYADIACDEFGRWPAAKAACEAVAEYEARTGYSASNATVEEHKAILGAQRGMLNASARYYFSFVELPTLRMQQHELHGLLGQRAIDPPHGYLPSGMQSEDRGEAGRTFAAPLSLGKQSDPAAEEAPAAVVGGRSSGRVRVAVTAFGTQGEGAIHGSFLEYEVRTLSDHSSFKHSLF